MWCRWCFPEREAHADRRTDARGVRFHKKSARLPGKPEWPRCGGGSEPARGLGTAIFFAARSRQKLMAALSSVSFVKDAREKENAPFSSGAFSNVELRLDPKS
jgi:hypothetical protein